MLSTALTAIVDNVVIVAWQCWWNISDVVFSQLSWNHDSDGSAVVRQSLLCKLSYGSLMIHHYLRCYNHWNTPLSLKAVARTVMLWKWRNTKEWVGSLWSSRWDDLIHMPSVNGVLTVAAVAAVIALCCISRRCEALRLYNKIWRPTSPFHLLLRASSKFMRRFPLFSLTFSLIDPLS